MLEEEEMVDHLCGKCPDGEEIILSYSELYLDYSLRLSVARRINYEHTILHCPCIESRPVVTLTNEGDFQFRQGAVHSRECASYIRMLAQRSVEYPYVLFSSNCRDLPVDFKWQKGCRRRTGFLSSDPLTSEDKKKGLTLGGLVYLVNILSFIRAEESCSSREADVFLKHLLTETGFLLSEHRLSDRDGNVLSLTPKRFPERSDRVGTVSYVYARIISMDMTHKTFVYLKTEGLGNASYFAVPRETWCGPQSLTDDYPLWISGICVRKERTSFQRGNYDSMTHQTYGGESKTYRQNEISSFVLFHTNAFGLVAFSPREAYAGNIALRAGFHLKKPLLPVNNTGSMPPLAVRTPDGTDKFFFE